ncbi:MAG: hypothetical protein ACREJD_17590 [Phycisphaerales bacterium]
MLNVHRTVASFWCMCLAVLLAALGGCAAALPTYPNLPAKESLEVLAMRAESVRSLSAQVELSLVNPQGQSIALDGAFAAIPPDRMRLQAWKFNTTVLDVTCTSDEVWSVPEHQSGSDSQSQGFSGGTSLQAETLLELSRPSFWRTARLVDAKTTDSELVVTSGLPGHEEVNCVVDRRTLTARQFSSFGTREAGGEQYSLSLEQYRLIDGVVWPTILVFTGPEGTVRVSLNDVEINKQIYDAVFVPPARAKQRQ